VSPSLHARSRYVISPFAAASRGDAMLRATEGASF
jgi:hypothetical protein